MEDLYPLLVVAHVVGAFLFVLAHGVSVFVSFRLRRERDLERIRALLDLSASTVGVVYTSLVLLLLAGIAAMVWHGWWRYGWPWLALAVFIGVATHMSQRGTIHYVRVRHAAGLRAYGDPPDRPAPQPAPEVLGRLLAASRAEELAISGGLALLVNIWCMVAKPF
jgi:hypothetical protein